jgi:hypothetical protein
MKLCLRLQQQGPLVALAQLRGLRRLELMLERARELEVGGGMGWLGWQRQQVAETQFGLSGEAPC